MLFSILTVQNCLVCVDCQVSLFSKGATLYILQSPPVVSCSQRHPRCLKWKDHHCHLRPTNNKAAHILCCPMLPPFLPTDNSAWTMILCVSHILSSVVPDRINIRNPHTLECKKIHESNQWVRIAAINCSFTTNMMNDRKTPILSRWSHAIPQTYSFPTCCKDS